MAKVSIRFYNDIPVRAIWNDEKNGLLFINLFPINSHCVGIVIAVKLVHAQNIF